MENGKINEFIDSITYQAAAWQYEDNKYFTDGISKQLNGNYYFFIMKYKFDSNEGDEIIYEFEAPTVEECLKAFCNDPIWDGKSFYDIEQKITWVDM